MSNTITKEKPESIPELENIPSDRIMLKAEYAFSNPYSINGPFGTMTIYISENDAEQSAFGTIKINTLWGLGSVTELRFNGNPDFNPSTGYTSLSTEGHGTITLRPEPPRYIKANITVALKPGFKEGILSVEGFFNQFKIKATAIHQTDE